MQVVCLQILSVNLIIGCCDRKRSGALCCTELRAGVNVYFDVKQPWLRGVSASCMLADLSYFLDKPMLGIVSDQPRTSYLQIVSSVGL